MKIQSSYIDLIPANTTRVKRSTPYPSHNPSNLINPLQNQSISFASSDRHAENERINKYANSLSRLSDVDMDDMTSKEKYFAICDAWNEYIDSPNKQMEMIARLEKGKLCAQMGMDEKECWQFEKDYFVESMGLADKTPDEKLAMVMSQYDLAHATNFEYQQLLRQLNAIGAIDDSTKFQLQNDMRISQIVPLSSQRDPATGYHQTFVDWNDERMTSYYRTPRNWRTFIFESIHDNDISQSLRACYQKVRSLLENG